MIKNLAVLGILMIMLPLSASELTVRFEAGNKLYAEEKYLEAVRSYQALLESGESSVAIYFNLGNAYFKTGAIGMALDAYRRAELISPRDPDLRANLKFARNQVVGPTLSPTIQESWLSTLALNEWLWLGAASLWPLFGLLAVRVLKPTWRQRLRSWLWTGFAVVVVVWSCFFLRYQSLSRQIAIVTVPEASVRMSPFEEASESFTAHDGAELRVLDQKDGWFQVSDENGSFGWLPATKLVIFGGSNG